MATFVVRGCKKSFVVLGLRQTYTVKHHLPGNARKQINYPMLVNEV